MASRMVSAGTMRSVPATKLGLKRPCSSNTRPQRISSMPVARPFSPTMRFGPQPGMKSMPSSPRDLHLLATLDGAHGGHLFELFQADHRHVQGAAPARLTRRIEGDPHLGSDDAAELLGGAFRAAEQHPHRGTRRVERHQAAPDHHHAPADLDPVATVDIEQEIDRLDHAVEVVPLDGQVTAAAGADAEEDGGVAGGAQLANAEIARRAHG